MLKHNGSIQNNENNGKTVTNVENQEQFSLCAKKVLEFVCTVIWTDELYAWPILLIEGIDLFQLRDQEVNKSEWITQKNKTVV